MPVRVMRIPIREQLGALILFSSLVGLAVVSIAIWVSDISKGCATRANLNRLEVTFCNFVIDVR